MKTASRILRPAFFKAGYEVQDAPVEACLERQGRFKHLFEPKRDEQGIAEIQARVDACRDKAAAR
jgi:hypothetical protein